MSEETKDKKNLLRIENLYLQRKEILSLPPEKALERILNASEPMPLVHSFPDQDFYFLLHDIGPDDALPLLSLASDKQREYILDIETWNRDRIDISAVTRWFDLLFRADERRVVHWLIEEKTDLLEFYIRKNIEVRLRDHDQDPVDFGKDFFTLDDTFYVKITGDLPADEDLPGDIDKKRYKDLLIHFIKRLADFDHITYQKILLEAAHLIPAEIEEEAYRLRGVRLAEKGFLPFDEAAGIYQPLKPQGLEHDTLKFVPETVQGINAPVPLYAAGMLQANNLFTRALGHITAEAILQQLQSEFAGLCNRIAVADHKLIRSKEDLDHIVKKACGYIAIGLHSVVVASGNEERGADDMSPELICRHPLSDIFRVGFGLALKLKWRTQKWLERSWFAQQGMSLTFWGEEWLGVLGGLLIKKPLYFDNYKSGVMYREFMSLDDLKAAESALNDILAFDDLLSLMDIEVKPLSSYRFLTYKNLLLTLWVREYIGLTGEARPLTLEEFTGFFSALWEPDEKPRKIRTSMKESFLRWLAGSTGLKDYEISETLGNTFEGLFAEVEEEYGRVLAEDLDPRYVYLFLLEK